MGEQNRIVIADELVEVDLALGGGGLEVGCLRAETEPETQTAVSIQEL